jgi:hypothetical protein
MSRSTHLGEDIMDEDMRKDWLLTYLQAACTTRRPVRLAPSRCGRMLTGQESSGSCLAPRMGWAVHA